MTGAFAPCFGTVPKYGNAPIEGGRFLRTRLLLEGWVPSIDLKISKTSESLSDEDDDDAGKQCLISPELAMILETIQESAQSHDVLRSVTRFTLLLVARLNESNYAPSAIKAVCKALMPPAAAILQGSPRDHSCRG